MRLLRPALTTCALATLLLGAENPFIGTWKLNIAKSKFSPGSEIREMTMTFELDGSKIKRIASGTDGEGKPIMQGGPEGDETPWDGKEHEVHPPAGTPVPPFTMLVKQVNDHTVDAILKRNGKVWNRNHSVVSDDGKTMTSTEDGVEQDGRKFHKVQIFEKQ